MFYFILYYDQPIVKVWLIILWRDLGESRTVWLLLILPLFVSLVVHFAGYVERPIEQHMLWYSGLCITLFWGILILLEVPQPFVNAIFQDQIGVLPVVFSSWLILLLIKIWYLSNKTKPTYWEGCRERSQIALIGKSWLKWEVSVWFMTKFTVTTKSYNSITITMFYVVVGLGVIGFFFFLACGELKFHLVVKILWDFHVVVIERTFHLGSTRSVQ